jgi:hypothetical protein
VLKISKGKGFIVGFTATPFKLQSTKVPKFLKSLEFNMHNSKLEDPMRVANVSDMFFEEFLEDSSRYDSPKTVYIGKDPDILKQIPNETENKEKEIYLDEAKTEVLANFDILESRHIHRNLAALMCGFDYHVKKKGLNLLIVSPFIRKIEAT